MKPMNKVKEAAKTLVQDRRFALVPVYGTNESGGCYCSDGKECSLKKPGKHPIQSEWQNKLLHTPDEIEEFWSKNPDSNFGVFMGETHRTPNYFVIDIDVSGEKRGLESFKILRSKITNFPETLSVRTATGGYHHYFLIPPDVDVNGFKKNIKEYPDIDFMFGNSYVVSPPSKIGIEQYTWVDHRSNIQPLPESLIELIGPKRITKKKKSPKKRTDFSKAAPGYRNDYLFRQCMRLFEAGLTKEQVESYVISSESFSSLPDPEIKSTINSANRMFGKRDSRFEPTRENVYIRFADKSRHSLMYVNEHRSFYYFDTIKGYWRSDEEKVEASYLARTVNSTLLDEMIDDMDDKDTQDAINNKILHLYVTHYEKPGSETSTVEASKKHLNESSENLNPNFYDLNTPRGTVDLRTGEIRDQNPKDMITKCTKVHYEKGFTTDLYWKTCELAIGPKEDIEQFFECLGMLLFDTVFEQKYWIVYGPGGTGKSSVFNPLLTSLGDYGLEIDRRDAIEQKFESSHDSKYLLEGRRFGMVAELKMGEELDASLVKIVTGGDSINTRKIRGEFSTIRSYCSLVVMTNNVPSMRNQADSGSTRRLKIVQMKKVIPQEFRNEAIVSELVKNAEHRVAALSMAVDGAVRFWEKRKNDPLYIPKLPDHMRESVEDFMEDQNPLRDWIESNCILDATATIKSSELYQSYSEYCKFAAIRPLTPNSPAFKQWLESMEVTRYRSGKTGNMYKGIKLKPKEERKEYEF